MRSQPFRALALSLSVFALALPVDALTLPGAAELRLPSILGDHMVVQRDATTRVWGWSGPGADVSVVASWGASGSATAAQSGAWSVELATPPAGGPFTLTVSSGRDERVLADVLAGDVWLCGGQSNMEWPLHDTDHGAEDVAAAAHPNLRLFDVAREAATSERDDCGGAWSPCTPRTARDFSAVGYLFGAKLHAELGVPIGLIGSNWGGTPAEAWTSKDTLQAGFPEFHADLAAGDGHEPTPHRPSSLFNGMIAPILPHAIKGAIWYQGEANRGRHDQYRRLFPAMIADWRTRFGAGDFPFYFVQLAPYGYGGDTGELSRIREAQALALLLPSTGMAVTTDVGDPADIHPRDKRTVGDRLARLALAKTYGKDVACEGPTFERLLTVEGRRDALRIELSHADGLTSNQAPIRSFTVAGADRVFHPAAADIDGTSIIVSSGAVAEPVAVRYCWGATDASNLWNAAGLPTPSFRSDDWPR